jgi:hypothetical protein
LAFCTRDGSPGRRVFDRQRNDSSHRLRLRPFASDVGNLTDRRPLARLGGREGVTSAGLRDSAPHTTVDTYSAMTFTLRQRERIDQRQLSAGRARPPAIPECAAAGGCVLPRSPDDAPSARAHAAASGVAQIHLSNSPKPTLRRPGTLLFGRRASPFSLFPSPSQARDMERREAPGASTRRPGGLTRSALRR